MVRQAFQKVFGDTAYIVLAACLSAAVLLLALWFPNLGLIVSVASSPDIAFVDKVMLPVSLLGSIGTNFSFFSASYTVAVAILFGIYAALVVYLLRGRVKGTAHGTTTGFLGIMSGAFGIGCATCGYIALPIFLSVIGVSGAMALLPFGGSEFGIIGIILLLIAIRAMAKQVLKPGVCKI